MALSDAEEAVPNAAMYEPPTTREELESAILDWVGVPLPAAAVPVPDTHHAVDELSSDTAACMEATTDSAELEHAAEAFLYLQRFLEARKRFENYALAKALGMALRRPKPTVTQNEFGETIRIFEEADPLPLTESVPRQVLLNQLMLQLINQRKR